MISGRRGCHQIQRTLAGEAIRLWSMTGDGLILDSDRPRQRCLATAERSRREVAMRVKDVATEALVWTTR
jgi:hypothetical protein